MTPKKIVLLIMQSNNESSSNSGRTPRETIEDRCKTLCESLNVEIDVSVLYSSPGTYEAVQELSQGADALIVNNERYAESLGNNTAEELKSFEAVAERGIPIVEVHERNIFNDGDSRPYLDSPSIGAGLVSGMKLGGYAVAISALVITLESNAL